MTTTHTPGPWRIVDREVMEDGSVYPCHILGGTADYQVCALESPDIAKRGVEQPHLFPGLNGVLGPNARLIAAAPDLLLALERITSSYHALLGRTPVRDAPETLAEADAAIAKARGAQ